MQSIVKSLKKLLPLGKKAKKYLPFFIGFKLLTFTGFITYIISKQMIFPSPKIAIALFLISIGLVVTFDIRFDQIKEKIKN